MTRAIAALTGKTDPIWVAAPPPDEIAPHQIVCRTLQLGVCGTDREIIGSAKPMVPLGSDYLILGHECLARVEAVGVEVTGIAPDDLVVPTVRRSIGEHSKRPDMLPLGRYSERGIVGLHGFSQPIWVDDPHYMIRVPDSISDLAIFTEPQSIAEKAINEATTVQQARLEDGIWNATPPRVLVTGMGPIGFAGIIAARSRGWQATMYGRDPSDSIRAQLAYQLGATYLNQRECDLGTLGDANRFDLVLESTGNDDVLLAAANALDHCGAMVWLGAARVSQARSHDLDSMMRRTLIHNQVHLGSVNSAPRDFSDAIRHLDKLKHENPTAAAGLITRRAAISEAMDHFIRREPRSIKTVFEY